MYGKNRPLVTYEPVEFETQPVQMQDFKKITDPLRGLYRIFLELIRRKKRKMSNM